MAIFQPSNNAIRAVQYFLNQGLPYNVAVGLTGNLMAESNLDPNIESERDDQGRFAYGIGQWRGNEEGGRQFNLRSFLDSQGQQADPFMSQLKFLSAELNPKSPYYDSLSGKRFEDLLQRNKIGSVTTVPDITKELERAIFRADGAGMDRRIDFADKLSRLGAGFFKNFKGGDINTTNLLAMQDAPKPKRGVAGGLLDIFTQPNREADRTKLLGNITLALNAMSTRPDQSLATSITEQIKQADAKSALQQNKTRMFNYFNSIGRKDLANAIASGVDPNTVYGNFSKGSQVKFDQENKIFNQFKSEQTVKDYQTTKTAYNKIRSSYENPSPASDIAMVFNFMKMLDPTSTVREGEYATASNAGRVDDKIKNAYNTLLLGYTLTDSQREDFVNTSGNLFEAQQESYDQVYSEYTKRAKDYGLNIENAVPDYRYTDEILNFEIQVQNPNNVMNNVPAEWSQKYNEIAKTTKDKYGNTLSDSMTDAIEKSAWIAWLNGASSQELAEYGIVKDSNGQFKMMTVQ